MKRIFLLTGRQGVSSSNKVNIRYLVKLLIHLQTKQVEGGFAMVVVSILSIVLFSLLAISLILSNLSRSRTTAFVDGSSSFYAAESGLNRQAEKLRQRFIGFSQPAGTSPANIGNCIRGAGGTGTGDFACENYTFNSGEPKVTQQGSSIISSNNQNLPYTAYTYVQPNPQNLATFPELKQIPAGEPFAGLTAQEYVYRLSSTAIRRENSTDPNSRTEGQIVLQMDFKSRIISLFQFAAFYENDMEFTPGQDMTVGGRIHTNANIRLSPAFNLNLVGPVTAGQDIYNSTGFAYPDATAAGGSVNFVDGSGNIRQDSLNNPLRFSTPPAPNQYVGPALTASFLAPYGDLLQPRVSRLQVPEVDFTSKADATQPGGIGEYYGKADLQLEFLPTQPVPFKLTAIKTGMTAGGCTDVTISSGRLGGPWQCSQLDSGQLRSLQQPVFVNDTTTEQAAVFCPNLATAKTGAPSVTAANKAKAVRALQTAIVSQATPLSYSSLTNNLSTLTDISTSFQANLAAAGVTGADQTALLATTPEKIAAANNGCFIPAPIRVINNFTDQREKRMIKLLQVNLRSLAAWNYYNISVDWSSSAVTNTYTGQGNNTDELLFQRAALDSTAPATSLPGLAAGTKSFGAADRAEGGLVLHGTIDKTAYSYTVKQSPYGFAIAQGSTLPAPLTVVSDQAIYLQGDYNNTGRQPAAIMGDTITVLSNACWDDTLGVKGPLTNECGRSLMDQGTATETTINAAFLAKTAQSNQTTKKYSGGLNNMMRFHEYWSGIKFNYSGSLVSIGTPQEFSGSLIASGSTYYSPPIRNWSYDTRFNQFSQLPPLSPRVIYLQQQVFGRKYN